VAGSLNATPVALDDTYPQTVQANETVNTATSGFTVVTNDYPGILAGNPVALSALTITAFDAASLNGGIVTMTASGANVGRFTYAAPPGFTGTDSFTYTITNGVAGTPVGSNVGKVTITVDWHQFEGVPDCRASCRGRCGEPSHLSRQRHLHQRHRPQHGRMGCGRGSRRHDV
jgi:hypothetical protein